MFPLLVLGLSPPCATRTYGHTNKPSANISGLGILFCGLSGNSTQPLGGGASLAAVLFSFIILIYNITRQRVSTRADSSPQKSHAMWAALARSPCPPSRATPSALGQTAR